MKILVTGAAGFIGSHLAECLLADGARVLGLDSFSDYYPRATKESNISRLRRHSAFTLVEARIQDAELNSLVRDVDYVFHLAGQPGVGASWGPAFGAYTADNVAATQALLKACVGSERLRRFVYASSSSVYGDAGADPMQEHQALQPVSPYGVTKLAAEHLCRLYFNSHRVPTVSLRYFTVYGPRQRPDMAFTIFMQLVMQDGTITVYGDGEQTRDFTFVGDAVAATMSAAQNGIAGQVYNIGGGTQVSIRQVLSMLGEIAGRELRVEYASKRLGDMPHTHADIGAAKHYIGFSPQVGIEDGLRAQWDWLTAEHE